MDSETVGAPATVDQGREPPAGSRGEAGQKDGVDLTPALATENKEVKGECTKCGHTFDSPATPCPDCGGLVREVGIHAVPVVAQTMQPAENDTPQDGFGPAGSVPEGNDDRKSATVADMSARGETEPQNPQSGGDARLQGERVHPTDAGSAGGGGGTGGG